MTVTLSKCFKGISNKYITILMQKQSIQLIKGASNWHEVKQINELYNYNCKQKSYAKPLQPHCNGETIITFKNLSPHFTVKAGLTKD